MIERAIFAIFVIVVLVILVGLILLGVASIRDIPSDAERARLCFETGGKWVQVSPDDFTCLYVYGR